MYRELTIPTSAPTASLAFRQAIRNVQSFALDACNSAITMALTPTADNAYRLLSDVQGMMEAVGTDTEWQTKTLRQFIADAHQDVCELQWYVEDNEYSKFNSPYIHRKLAEVTFECTRALAEASSLCREFPV